MGYSHHKFVKRKMGYKQALPVIRDQWFANYSQSSTRKNQAVVVHQSREVALQREVVMYSQSSTRKNQAVVVHQSREVFTFLVA